MSWFEIAAWAVIGSALAGVVLLAVWHMGKQAGCNRHEWRTDAARCVHCGRVESRRGEAKA